MATVTIKIDDGKMKESPSYSCEEVESSGKPHQKETLHGFNINRKADGPEIDLGNLNEELMNVGTKLTKLQDEGFISSVKYYDHLSSSKVDDQSMYVYKSATISLTRDYGVSTSAYYYTVCIIEGETVYDVREALHYILYGCEFGTKGDLIPTAAT